MTRGQMPMNNQETDDGPRYLHDGIIPPLGVGAPDWTHVVQQQGFIRARITGVMVAPHAAAMARPTASDTPSVGIKGTAPPATAAMMHTASAAESTPAAIKHNAQVVVEGLAVTSYVSACWTLIVWHVYEGQGKRAEAQYLFAAQMVIVPVQPHPPFEFSVPVVLSLVVALVAV